MALLVISIYFDHSEIRRVETPTYLPLGSVCFDQVGVQRITVSAQYAGKCSSNIRRYQYLYSSH